MSINLKLLFLYFLLLGVVTAFPDSTEVREDDENTNEKRIIGGKQAVMGQFPYLVMLTHKAKISGLNQTTKLCGGAIIRPNWILTAGHCIRSLYSEYQGLKWDRKIAAGTTNLWDDWNKFRQDIPMKEAIVHPLYNAGKQPHDLALICLNYSLQFNPYVQPIDIMPEDASTEKEAIAAGWGALSKTETYLQARDLQYLDPHPIADLEECKRQYTDYEGFPSLVTDDHICLESVGGKSPCYGDSGSPLVHKRNGRNEVIGVASFVKDMQTCGDHPTVYAKVEKKWIDDVINTHPC